MKKRTTLLAILLMLSAGNYVRIVGTENIRAIEFLSIFTIGALSALLIRELIGMFKKT